MLIHCFNETSIDTVGKKVMLLSKAEGAREVKVYCALNYLQPGRSTPNLTNQ